MAPTSPPTRAMLATVRSLAIDQVAGQVVESLAERGIRSVLLKGASFARWLYDDGQLRTYGDIDLLVAPEQVQAAGLALRELGYTQRCAGGADGEQADHAVNWDRPGSPTIDLHRTISGRIAASPERCWEVISSATRPAVIGGRPAEILTVPALAVHVVLHAEEAVQKTMDDLGRALARLDIAQWKQGLELAARLDALAAFGAGLRLLPEGEAVAVRLALPATLSVELVLQVSSTQTLAHPFERVARAPGLRAKARVVLRELVPTPSFIREWCPRARRGPGWMAIAYLYRLVWVPYHAPKGLRAWLRARRVVADVSKPGGGIQSQ